MVHNLLHIVILGRDFLSKHHFLFKGTNPALKKPSNIPEIYAKMFGWFL